MKFDLSQFAELDRTDLLEITGGYYGTQNIYVRDSYVYKNASQSYRDSVDSGKYPNGTKGSTYGYTSAGGGQASSTYVKPAGYLVPTTGGGHYYVDPNGILVEANGKPKDPANPVKAPTNGSSLNYKADQEYKMIILYDEEGAGGGALGHAGVIIQTADGKFRYYSKEGKPGSPAPLDELGKGMTDNNGNCYKEFDSLDSLNRGLKGNWTEKNKYDDGKGVRYDLAKVYSLDAADAKAAQAYLNSNVFSPYSLAGNNCGDLTQGALNATGMSGIYATPYTQFNTLPGESIKIGNTYANLL